MISVNLNAALLKLKPALKLIILLILQFSTKLSWFVTNLFDNIASMNSVVQCIQEVSDSWCKAFYYDTCGHRHQMVIQLECILAGTMKDMRFMGYFLRVIYLDSIKSHFESMFLSFRTWISMSVYGNVTRHFVNVITTSIKNYLHKNLIYWNW